MTSDIQSRLAAALADRYRIERELGAGGMATVYLAHDEKHDRKVAIKVLKPELAAVLGAERFVVEIKTTASLQHPHILPLFDSGTADGFLFYVMPYIEGETIREKLNRETQFGVDEAVRIAEEVADALDYAHRHGVIHRDIKPENILLHDGRAMVMDFGIALAVSAAAGGRMTETGLSLGTPHYMSPEQATAEKEITPKSDLYSLASVLYEMLAGQPPHVGGPAQQVIMRIITEPSRPVSEFRKNVSANVVAALQKSLEKLPADRFESVKAFGDALHNPWYGATRPGETLPPSTTRPDRRWWLITAASLVIVGAIALSLGRRLGAPERGTAGIYTPIRLGGPPVVMSPRLSPDGTMIAFIAIVNGTSQVGVLNLASGDWRILTRDTLTGVAQQPVWTPDGSRILFARVPADAPNGIYAVSPASDGTERMIFPGACSPVALTDGSILGLKYDAQRLLRLYRYFPQSGRVDTMPVHSTPSCSTVAPIVDVLPGDREAVVVGGTGPARALDSLLAVDLGTRKVRNLWAGPPGSPRFGVLARSLRALPDGNGVLFPLATGGGFQILRIPTDGSGRAEALFSTTGAMEGIDGGRDGTIYVDQSSSPSQIVSYDPKAGTSTSIMDDNERHHGLPLADGRILISAPAGGATRIMAVAPGRDPVGFLASGEESSQPIAMLGPDRVMMRTRGDSGYALTIAYVANGRIAGRIQHFNHPYISGSVDGKTIYYADSGAIWAMPSTGGNARKLRDGDAVAVSPDGSHLVVSANSESGVRLFRIPLNGEKESEIVVRGAWKVAVAEIETNAVGPDGRIVARVSSPTRWAWPTGIIDPKTGSVTVVPPGPALDGYGGWGPGGTVVTFAWATAAKIWAFKPAGVR